MICWLENPHLTPQWGGVASPRMKRIRIFLSLLVCVSALSGCGAASNMVGSAARLLGNTGHLVGL